MQIKPVGKKLLVEVQAKEKKSLILTVETNDKPFEAKVRAIGDKIDIRDLQVGDTVLIGPYCGMRLEGATKEETILLVQENEVLGILK